MCNEVLVWMFMTEDMFGGQWLDSVGMVVLAKYGKSALTSAL